MLGLAVATNRLRLLAAGVCIIGTLAALSAMPISASASDSGAGAGVAAEETNSAASPTATSILIQYCFG